MVTPQQSRETQTSINDKKQVYRTIQKRLLQMQKRKWLWPDDFGTTPRLRYEDGVSLRTWTLYTLLSTAKIVVAIVRTVLFFIHNDIYIS